MSNSQEPPLIADPTALLVPETGRGSVGPQEAARALNSAANSPKGNNYREAPKAEEVSFSNYWKNLG